MALNKVVSWLRNLGGCIRRYPLQTIAFVAADVACYRWLCTYFAVMAGVIALVMVSKNKEA
jgi:hypothetical protein